MDKVRKLKYLNSLLQENSAKAEKIKMELSSIQKEYSLITKTIKDIKDEINKISFTKEIGISEHAIVRYFERVKGYDLEEIKKEILSDKVINLIEKLGENGTYPNDKGYRLVLKNNVVTTIIN